MMMAVELKTLVCTQDLARLLPSLANSRRPSKSAIVNGSINHLSFQREQRLTAASEIRRIFAEKDTLLGEVNEWRARNGIPARESQGWTQSLESILSVETEVFGTFTGMGDGDGDGEGDGEPETNDGDDVKMQHLSKSQHLDVPMGNAAAAATGVLTGQPCSFDRSSTGDLFGTGSSVSSSFPGSTDSCGRMPLSGPTQHRQFSFAATESSVLSQSPQMAGSLFGTQPSPIDSHQHLALQAFLSGNNVSRNRFARGSAVLDSPSGQSGGVITPPAQETHGDHVSTFSPPSPPTVATSFAKVGSGEEDDHVSEWAAQQLMVQFQSSHRQPRGSHGGLGHGTSGGSVGGGGGQKVGQFDLDEFAARLNSMSGSEQHHHHGQPSSHHHGHPSQLDAAHRALLARQPHLAAAAFPPPYAEASVQNGAGASQRDAGFPYALGAFPGHSSQQESMQSQLEQFLNANPVSCHHDAMGALSYTGGNHEDHHQSWLRQSQSGGGNAAAGVTSRTPEDRAKLLRGFGQGVRTTSGELGMVSGQ